MHKVNLYRQHPRRKPSIKLQIKCSQTHKNKPLENWLQTLWTYEIKVDWDEMVSSVRHGREQDYNSE